MAAPGTIYVTNPMAGINAGYNPATGITTAVPITQVSPDPLATFNAAQNPTNNDWSAGLLNDLSSATMSLQQFGADFEPGGPVADESSGASPAAGTSSSTFLLIGGALLLFLLVAMSGGRR